VWGGLSGVTSTLLHAGGPPISIYFLSKKLEKKTMAGSGSDIFCTDECYKNNPLYTA
jgi:hypothetical protein